MDYRSEDFWIVGEGGATRTRRPAHATDGKDGGNASFSRFAAVCNVKEVRLSWKVAVTPTSGRAGN